MGVVLTRAGRDVYDRVQDLLQAYYPDLVEAQLKTEILFVHPDPNSVDKPPLKGPGGHPVPADIKATSYEARVSGLADVKIKLDAQAWESYREEERMWVLDSQLYRLEAQREKPKKAKKGQPGPSGPLALITDDLGRPKLRLRPYDHQIQANDAMARRHGRAALDARAVADLSLHYHTLGYVTQVTT